MLRVITSIFCLHIIFSICRYSNKDSEQQPNIIFTRELDRFAENGMKDYDKKSLELWADKDEAISL